MNAFKLLPALIAVLLLAGNARAQQAATCPQLPTASGLSWEMRAIYGTVFCRAVAADGSEAFGLYISGGPNFTPTRGNRREQGNLGNQAVFWYRAEIAADPGIQARETSIQLADGRYVHAWLQAPSQQELQAGLQLIANLQFGAPDSGQVAGN